MQLLRFRTADDTRRIAVVLSVSFLSVDWRRVLEVILPARRQVLASQAKERAIAAQNPLTSIEFETINRAAHAA